MRSARLFGVVGAWTLIIGAAAACNGLPRGTGEEGLAMRGQLELRVSTDRARYAPGDTILATFSVTNAGVRLTVRFSSGQRYDFALLDAAGREIWRWSAERGFIQVLGEETVEPGGSLRYQERIAAPREAGTYRLVAELVSMDGPHRTVATLTVGP